jgi:outer membrane protein TolC
LLSIKEAEQLALNENLELKISRLEIQKAGQQLREARSGFLPQLSANTSYLHYIKPLVFFLPGNLLDPNGSPEFQAIPASAKNTYNASVDAVVPILNLETNRTLKSTRLRNVQVEMEDKIARQRKITQVRQAAYGLLLAQASEKLAKTALKRNEINLQDARNRLKLGYLSETDTLQLYLTTENARISIVKANNSLEFAKAQFKLLLNLPESQDFQLSDTLSFSQGSFLQEDFNGYESSIDNSPEIQKLELSSKIMESNIRLERSRLLPRLSGVWQYAAIAQADDLKFGNYFWVNSHYVGLQLSVPIFSGFRQTGRISQSLIEQKQTDYQLAAAKKGYLLESRTYFNQMRELSVQLTVQQKNIGAGERLYESVRSRWQKGLAKLGDLQDAELALNQTKNNYLQLVYDYLTARENLNRILGRVD